MRKQFIIILVVVMMFTSNISAYATTYEPGTPLSVALPTGIAVKEFVTFVLAMASAGVVYDKLDDALGDYGPGGTWELIKPPPGPEDPDGVMFTIAKTISGVSLAEVIGDDTIGNIRDYFVGIFGPLEPGLMVVSNNDTFERDNYVITNITSEGNKTIYGQNGIAVEVNVHSYTSYDNGVGIVNSYKVRFPTSSGGYIDVDTSNYKHKGDPVIGSWYQPLNNSIYFGGGRIHDNTISVGINYPLNDNTTGITWGNELPIGEIGKQIEVKPGSQIMDSINPPMQPYLPGIATLDPGNGKIRPIVLPDGTEQLIYDGTEEEYIQDVTDNLTWEDIQDPTDPSDSAIVTPGVNADGDEILILNPTWGDAPYPEVNQDPITDPSEFQGKNIGLLQSITNWISKIFQPPTKSINILPLMNLDIQEKFPFSLPWDLRNIVSMFEESPQAPRWELPIKGEVIVIDFDRFEELAQISRSFLSIIWVVALIFITRGVL